MGWTRKQCSGVLAKKAKVPSGEGMGVPGTHKALSETRTLPKRTALPGQEREWAVLRVQTGRRARQRTKGPLTSSRPQKGGGQGWPPESARGDIRERKGMKRDERKGRRGERKEEENVSGGGKGERCARKRMVMREEKKERREKGVVEGRKKGKKEGRKGRGKEWERKQKFFFHQ